MIPNHIINKFKEDFKQEPSIITIDPTYIKTDLDKVFRKSRLIWIVEEVDGSGNRTTKSKLLEYDSYGIYVYINLDGKLFILTTIDRKNISDFMVNSLKHK